MYWYSGNGLLGPVALPHITHLGEPSGAFRIAEDTFEPAKIPAAVHGYIIVLHFPQEARALGYVSPMGVGYYFFEETGRSR